MGRINYLFDMGMYEDNDYVLLNAPEEAGKLLSELVGYIIARGKNMKSAIKAVRVEDYLKKTKIRSLENIKACYKKEVENAQKEQSELQAMGVSFMPFAPMSAVEHYDDLIRERDKGIKRNKQIDEVIELC